MILNETCPECGSDLEYLQIATYPPISVKRCMKCSWSLEGERLPNIGTPFKKNAVEIEQDNIVKNDTNNIVTNQCAKADQGKARLTLVPRKILYDIARIREYGNKKYGDPDNWKTVEPWRYRDAMMRHMCAYLDDPSSCDEESGLPHLWHLACNVAFLCEMENSQHEERKL